jgi:hypothetical protein
MSEPKHSPGPWRVAKTDDGNFGIVSKYGEWIANCYLWAKPVDNARLIAAAPEMLEVLRWLDNEMDCLGGCMFSRRDFEKVRAAIKKAMNG